MAVAFVMQCDLKHCTNSVKESEDISGWWCVTFSEDISGQASITIYTMNNDDFKNHCAEFYCCLAHAQQAIGVQMSLMQQDIINSLRVENELAAVVTQMKEVATVYSQSGDVEKPDENQA